MKESYIQQLARYLENDLMPNLSLQEKGYAELKEANDLVFSDPLAFVLGLLFDQSIKSSIAWESPYFLRERLGHLDAEMIAHLNEEYLEKIIARKKSLHRYPKTVSRYIVSTCNTIVTKFSGDPSNIWRNQSHFTEAKKNFLSLKGIGEKKANLAILMLARDFGVQFKDITDLPLAIDVHLQRVLSRSGFFSTNSKENLQTLRLELKTLYPNFPALLGTAIWFIGRHYS